MPTTEPWWEGSCSPIRFIIVCLPPILLLSLTDAQEYQCTPDKFFIVSLDNISFKHFNKIFIFPVLCVFLRGKWTSSYKLVNTPYCKTPLSARDAPPLRNDSPYALDLHFNVPTTKHQVAGSTHLLACWEAFRLFRKMTLKIKRGRSEREKNKH